MKAVVVSIWLLVAAGSAMAEPRVVTSIPPLHSLVAAVTAGVTEPHLLVPNGASPHAYALRPSDRRALSEADLIVWVGPDLEFFLEKALASGSRARHLEMTALPGLLRLPARHGGKFEGAGHDHEPPGDHRHHDGLDPHVWLDPDNARVLLGAVAAALVEIDPANAARYHANRLAAERELAVTVDTIERRLAPIKRRPYVVFHDAYRYFEQHFGLNAVAAVTVSPEQRPGARRLSEIRESIRASGAHCVFTEPQFEPSMVRVVTEDTGARSGELDPLGAGLTPGPGLYPRLLERLALSLEECLS